LNKPGFFLSISLLPLNPINPESLKSGISEHLCTILIPDAKKISFCTNRSGRHNIWTINNDGSNAQALFTTPVSESWSVWSPSEEFVHKHKDRLSISRHAAALFIRLCLNYIFLATQGDII
jgi:hypothetical protein